MAFSNVGRIRGASLICEFQEKGQAEVLIRAEPWIWVPCLISRPWFFLGLTNLGLGAGCVTPLARTLFEIRGPGLNGAHFSVF